MQASSNNKPNIKAKKNTQAITQLRNFVNDVKDLVNQCKSPNLLVDLKSSKHQPEISNMLLLFIFALTSPEKNNTPDKWHFFGRNLTRFNDRDLSARLCDKMEIIL
jgi:hypothetical protein